MRFLTFIINEVGVILRAETTSYFKGKILLKHKVLAAVMNHWTVPLEGNGGREYWNASN